MAVRVHVAVDAAGRPRDFELVERKGIGHPDTICDGVAEEFARRLCRFYLDRFGVILHHNVDKALLRAGAARTAFGGGEVVEAIELFLGGRATEEHRGVSVPVAELAREAAQDWFARHFHALDPARHLRVHCLTRPGSRDLTELFARVGAGEVPLANDTSCGVGFAPRTRLERAVQGIEEQINAPQTKRLHPEWGEDVKVLGFRHGSRASITLACAFVDAFVPDLETYRRSRESLARAAQARGAAELGFEPALAVNAGDDVDAGRIYLTVTGTSAEAGDDGEVGR
ncbi:MAG TPA: methionine adenosyltransferase, partial [Myxococcota bacterium]|nr:methionine adenosyltransferase [Myxococcota bacterium]